MNDLITSAARWIVARRLQVPALLFLEMNIPLTTVFHTALLAAEPLGTPLFGAERIEPLKNLLSDRKNIMNLVREIQCLSDAHGAR